MLFAILWSCRHLEQAQGQLDQNQLVADWKKWSTMAVVAHVAHTYEMSAMENYMVRAML